MSPTIASSILNIISTSKSYLAKTTLTQFTHEHPFMISVCPLRLGGGHNCKLNFSKVNLYTIFFSSNFSPSRRTIFIIHGYRNDYNSEWLHELKDELLIKV